jgi:hypothetical protein
VRAPLVWLGEADPVGSMEATREQDPELTAIRELFGHWQQHFEASVTALQVANVGGALDLDRNPKLPEFHDLLRRMAGDKGNAISTKRLGAWLRRIQGKVVDGLRLVAVPGRAGGHAPKFHLQSDKAKAEQQPATEDVY